MGYLTTYATEYSAKERVRASLRPEYATEGQAAHLVAAVETAHIEQVINYYSARPIQVKQIGYSEYTYLNDGALASAASAAAAAASQTFLYKHVVHYVEPATGWRRYAVYKCRQKHMDSRGRLLRIYSTSGQE